MKKNTIFLLIALIFGMLACNKEVFQIPDDINPTTLAIETSSGYKSTGIIYVQKGVMTGLKVSSTAGTITGATWSIEGLTYEGVSIIHKFMVLGDIPVSVNATVGGVVQTHTFTAKCVLDLSEFDPVRYFVTANTSANNWNVLLLFSKERVRFATDTNFFFSGTVPGWNPTPVPPADKRYIITPDGQPQRTSDIGKYIGVNLTMSAANNGDNSTPLIHSGSQWTDISGSAFARGPNYDNAYFNFQNGVVTPNGTPGVITGPGEGGDNFFRYGPASNSLTVFFKLAENYTGNEFFVRQLEGGTYSAPILLYPVEGFPQWGKHDIDPLWAEGTVMALRYGPNLNTPNVYSENQNLSLFYDSYFKNIRFSLSNLQGQ